MKITKNAHLRNAIGLPIAPLSPLDKSDFDLWEAHLKKTYGLSHGRASLCSSLIDMWSNPYGR